MENLIKFAKALWITSSATANCLMILVLVYAAMACDSTAIGQIVTLWMSPALFTTVIYFILTSRG